MATKDKENLVPAAGKLTVEQGKQAVQDILTEFKSTLLVLAYASLRPAVPFAAVSICCCVQTRNSLRKWSAPESAPSRMCDG